ncbi:MAG: hypothetical protein AXW12_10055 [Thalassospira sp. Nap_22]|nr:MAG: hypothetical protein AXW12_10055 [Thalassospira sp. Nap_22]
MADRTPDMSMFIIGVQYYECPKVCQQDFEHPVGTCFLTVRKRSFVDIFQLSRQNLSNAPKTFVRNISVGMKGLSR